MQNHWTNLHNTQWQYLLGDVGWGGHVNDGQQSGFVCSQLIVQTILHSYRDGCDLIAELTIVLRQNVYM